ncbi:MAG: hypothetical protein J0H40_04950 [Rhizobiales bacterium]|nr:hypothetical protein [Hyphomicrobiales bacterium]
MRSLTIQRHIAKLACRNCLGAFAERLPQPQAILTPQLRAMLSPHGIWYARMDVVKTAIDVGIWKIRIS